MNFGTLVGEYKISQKAPYFPAFNLEKKIKKCLKTTKKKRGAFYFCRRKVQPWNRTGKCHRWNQARDHPPAEHQANGSQWIGEGTPWRRKSWMWRGNQLPLYKADCWKIVLCKLMSLNTEWEQHDYAQSKVSMNTG